MTKGDTLDWLRLRLKKSKIEDLFIFTVLRWDKHCGEVMDSIHYYFNDKIVIRSSSQNEDAQAQTKAGSYKSFLDIDVMDENKIKRAITEIINDYEKKDKQINKNQILIQNYVQDTIKSGVVFTRNPKNNTLYYLINYDNSGSTDSVTSGKVSKKIEILRSSKNIPKKWTKLIDAVKEIESLYPDKVLDIEFAITKTDIVIFQVRELAIKDSETAIHDKQINEKVKQFGKQFTGAYLSDMAFWNPAEIIGDKPNYLDISLYNHLILKQKWNEGLTILGYTKVNDGLMTTIGSKPYINVDNAFLSLMPSKLPVKLKQRLLKYYNARLYNHPALHDKIEFKIAFTCYDFTLEQRIEVFYSLNDFTHAEVGLIVKELRSLTNGILISFSWRIEQDRCRINNLERCRSNLMHRFEENITWEQALITIRSLLDNIIIDGAQQFSSIARMAFIGKSLIDSLKEIDSKNKLIYDKFLASTETVATEMDQMIAKLNKGDVSLDEYLIKYGHLRPGTYDITKLPYKKDPDYCANLKSSAKHKAKCNKEELDIIIRSIDDLCDLFKLESDGHDLLHFVENTIQLREHFKFIFTKSLSDAIELIAYVGELSGFSREQMAYLHIDDIISFTNRYETCNRWSELILNRIEQSFIDPLISMPSIVYTKNDFEIVQTYTSSPNFVTNLNVTAKVAIIDKTKSLKGKIVVLEKADPGYDWIFTKGIAGLLTKYGGACSHMAIRCMEFNLPAAVGCGEQIYDKALKSKQITLDCKNSKINF